MEGRRVRQGYEVGLRVGSPNLLMRNGWRRDSLKKGDIIIVQGPGQGGIDYGECKNSELRRRRRVFNAGSPAICTPGAPTQ